MKLYRRIDRISRKERGETSWIKIPLLYCEDCKNYHRALPESLMPYKHYEARIIRGVVSGSITCMDLDFEEYPCEDTMLLWKREFVNDFSLTDGSS